MEPRYINPNYESEKEALKAIADKALADAENIPTPTKEVFDTETKEYISARFPKTNDDTLQEDFSRKVITDLGVWDRIDEHKEEGDRTQDEVQKTLQDTYHELEEKGLYIFTRTEMENKVQELCDNLKKLESKNEVVELSHEAQHIKEELMKIQTERMFGDSLEKLYKEYDAVLHRYQALSAVKDPDDFQQN